jgi:sulfur-carrier protein
MSDASPTVTVRYWAGARRAAGLTQERLSGAALADLLDQLGQRPELAAVLGRASYLVDGVSAEPSTLLSEGAVVDVLPPFAGG